MDNVDETCSKLFLPLVGPTHSKRTAGLVRVSCLAISQPVCRTMPANTHPLYPGTLCHRVFYPKVKTSIMKSFESYQTAHAGMFKTETCYIYHYTACNGLRFETIASSLNECRKARDRWLRSLSVSFTGHRHLSEHTDSLLLKLKEEIIRTYQAASVSSRRAVLSASIHWPQKLSFN